MGAPKTKTGEIVPASGLKKNGRQGEGGGVAPRVFDKKEIKQVEKLAACLTISQIADIMGISEKTFYDIKQRQPEVGAAYKRGASAAISGVATGLLQRALKGDNACTFFYLKTKGRWRENDPVAPPTSSDSVSDAIDDIVNAKDKD